MHIVQKKKKYKNNYYIIFQKKKQENKKTKKQKKIKRVSNLQFFFLGVQIFYSLKKIYHCATKT